MKSKKSKAASKLKSLKEKEISLPEEVNLLDEDISFEEQKTALKTDFESENESNQDDDAANDHSTRVMSSGQQSYVEKISSPAYEDEGTAVLSDENNNEDDATTAHVTASTNETTYREITAGRNRQQETEKVSYGDVYEADGNGLEQFNSVDGLLKQSEHLRVAQEKINDLENELEVLRKENDELLSAADTFKVLSEDYYAQLERVKVEFVEVRETLNQEMKILKDSLHEKERQNNELKQANSDLKAKVESNFKAIRKRERDLEYRLELAKVEEAALLKSKDRMILELRRRTDKLEQEMEAYRDKNKEHYQKLQEQQQTVRAVVRALRIALTRLEGDFGVDFEVLKKAE
ncbi:MAG: hypothetical protein H6623_00445 [Bdellovibrionaceae bacterium]|nr:hypothetical protein [Pseudobdellovibrionaceae bacterium]